MSVSADASATGCSWRRASRSMPSMSRRRARSADSTMRRRHFIGLIGGSLAARPWCADAAAATLPAIGFLSTGSPMSSTSLSLAEWHRALIAGGFVVFSGPVDPVTQGLVDSIPHPGGNITGDRVRRQHRGTRSGLCGAGRPPGRAGDQIRPRGQYQNGQGTRPDHAAGVAGECRRADRVTDSQPNTAIYICRESCGPGDDVAMKLGEILVAQGLVSRADVDAALERQKTDGGRLGSILVAMGVLTVSQLLLTLHNQKQIDSALD